MSQIVASIFGNLLAALVIGVVVTASVIYFFAREDAMWFLAGLRRVIWSLVVSPIRYIRKSVVDLARYGRDGEDRGAGDQYLLNRFMTILQAIIVFAAIMIVTAGCITAWKVLIPPADVRQAYREAKQSLAETREQLTAVTAQVQQLDTAWESSKAAEIAKARAPHEQSAREAAAALASAETTATEWGGNVLATLSQMKAVAQRTATPREAYEVSRAASDLREVINSNWYALTDEDRSLLNAWLGRWQQKKNADLAAGAVTEESVRGEAQPSYERAAEEKARLDEAVKERESTVETLKAGARLHFGRALWALVTTAATFIFVVWLYGLFLEAIWMGIHVAGDIRRLRLIADHGGSAPLAAPDVAQSRSAHHEPASAGTALSPTFVPGT